MNRIFCGVKTQSHYYLVIPESWVENKENRISKIFYSPNETEIADFSLPTKYFVDENKKACYNVWIMRYMRKCINIYILNFHSKALVWINFLNNYLKGMKKLVNSKIEPGAVSIQLIISRANEWIGILSKRQLTWPTNHLIISSIPLLLVMFLKWKSPKVRKWCEFVTKFNIL